jgi:putative transposase
MISFKWRQFQKDVILLMVRWYILYSLSYRDIEEMMLERSIAVDHSTINRWVIHYSPLLEKAFRENNKRKTGSSWRMDETYIKIKGNWHYLYRAVDKEGDTIDFMLSEKRDEAAAKAFFTKAIGSSGLPKKITMDKSGANKGLLAGSAKKYILRDKLLDKICIFMSTIYFLLIIFIDYIYNKILFYQKKYSC